jgi:hypothetical protein
MLIFSTVRTGQICLPRKPRIRPELNIPKHIPKIRTKTCGRAESLEITQRTGRLRKLNRLLERALPVGWMLQGRLSCGPLLLEPSGAAATAVPEVPAWRTHPSPNTRSRKTQTCRRGTARVSRIAKSAKRVNEDQHFRPAFRANRPLSDALPHLKNKRHLDRSIAASPRCAVERPRIGRCPCNCWQYSFRMQNDVYSE